MQFDLTPKISEFLDKHFVVHLLEHLKQKVSSSTRFDVPTTTDIPDNDDNNGDSQSQNEFENESNNSKASLISTMPMKEDDLNDDKTNDIVSFYSPLTINQGLYQVLNGTYMVDDQTDIYSTLEDAINTKKNEMSKSFLKKLQPKQKMQQRREHIIKAFEQYQDKCEALLILFEDEAHMHDLVKQKKLTMAYLKEFHNVKSEDLDSLYEYCRLRYEMGYYEDTDTMLGYFIELCETDEAKKHKAMFGKLAVEILEGKWTNAITDIESIFKHIHSMTRLTNRAVPSQTTTGASNEDNKDDSKNEAGGDTPAAQSGSGDTHTEKTGEQASTTNSNNAAIILREKAWLLHWSLFIYFNHNDGDYLDALVSLFTDKNNMNTIQTIAPHLLRYMAAAALISESITDKLQALVEVSKYIDEEQYTYKDPITEFVRLVIRVNDFDAASKMLKLAYNVCKQDFFLCYYSHYFLQYARLVFVRKYCRLFSIIDVTRLSKLLWLDHLSTEEIQNWMVNAVREIQSWDANKQRDAIDARLDVGNNILYVQVEDTNPYQVMLEKTRHLTGRTIYLIQDLNKNQKYKAQSDA